MSSTPNSQEVEQITKYIDPNTVAGSRQFCVSNGSDKSSSFEPVQFTDEQPQHLSKDEYENNLQATINKLMKEKEELQEKLKRQEEETEEKLKRQEEETEEKLKRQEEDTVKLLKEKKEVEDKNSKLLAENESLRANSPAKKGSESKQSVLNGDASKTRLFR